MKAIISTLFAATIAVAAVPASAHYLQNPTTSVTYTVNGTINNGSYDGLGLFGMQGASLDGKSASFSLSFAVNDSVATATSWSGYTSALITATVNGKSVSTALGSSSGVSLSETNNLFSNGGLGYGLYCAFIGDCKDQLSASVGGTISGVPVSASINAYSYAKDFIQGTDTLASSYSLASTSNNINAVILAGTKSAPYLYFSLTGTSFVSNPVATTPTTPTPPTNPTTPATGQVPEPESLALIGIGLLGFALARRCATKRA